MNRKPSVIDDVFAKEIGMNIYSALNILTKNGISIEDMTEITGKVKTAMIEEIEKRNIPHEFRFLLINIILCSMFATSIEFHKEYMKLSEDRNIEFIKEK